MGSEELGAFDFAGGLVVKMATGVAVFVAVLVVGRLQQLWIQAQAAAFTVLWVSAGTFVVLTLVRFWQPLRVSDSDERHGIHGLKIWPRATPTVPAPRMVGGKGLVCSSWLQILSLSWWNGDSRHSCLCVNMSRKPLVV